MRELKRPGLLEALCRLSLAGSGTGFVLFFLTGVFYPGLEKYITGLTNITETEKLSTLYFLCFSMFFGISLWGVLKMRKLEKTGFFLYLAAQTGIVLYPVVILGRQAFSSVSLIFSLLFVVLYATQLFGKDYQSLEK